jgi:hypothetical protein
MELNTHMTAPNILITSDLMKIHGEFIHLIQQELDIQVQDSIEIHIQQKCLMHICLLTKIELQQLVILTEQECTQL